MLPVFDPQDLSCKSPFGAVPCGAEISFSLRDTDYYACELLVRREFAEAHPTLIKNFLEEYGTSITYINENTAEAAQLVEKNNITKAAVAEKAIPKCNITFIEGAEMKTKVEGFLKVLFDMKPEAVGGTMPGDDFYYESK